MTDTIKISRELLPCPHCSGNAEMRLYDCEYFAQCVECFASTAADFQSEDEAAEAWNRRAQPSEPQGGEEVQVVAIAEGSGQLPESSWRGLRWSPSINPMDVPANSDLMTVAQYRRLMAEQLERADCIADLCRFLAKLYCELDALRYSTAKLPPEQIAEHMLFRWPVLQGTRNQISIKRISEQPYDQEALHAGIAAMLARAKEKNHGK